MLSNHPSHVTYLTRFTCRPHHLRLRLHLHHARDASESSSMRYHIMPCSCFCTIRHAAPCRVVQCKSTLSCCTTHHDTMTPSRHRHRHHHRMNPHHLIRTALACVHTLSFTFHLHACVHTFPFHPKSVDNPTNAHRSASITKTPDPKDPVKQTSRRSEEEGGKIAMQNCKITNSIGTSSFEQWRFLIWTSSRPEYWEKPKSLPFHRRMGDTCVTGESEGGVDGEETPAGCEDDGFEPLAFALVALSHSSSS